jgi:hypothetical protein
VVGIVIFAAYISYDALSQQSLQELEGVSQFEHYAHSGIFVRGRTTVSFVTPDDYESESDAVFAAEKIIHSL